MLQPCFPTVIDSTVLAQWRSCRHHFWLETINHWKLQGTSIHLHAGGAFARGLEVARKSYYIEKLPVETAVALGAKALLQEYGEFDAGDSAKSPDRMLGALEFYFDKYQLDQDEAKVTVLGGVPAIEFSFAIPLPITNPDTGEPLLFAGRFDAVVEYASGLYGLDDKTTSSLGSSWARQWDLRGQFLGYAWALREHGIANQGTIIRGVSILKTKYETQQAVVSQPDWKVDRWYEDTIAEVDEMIQAYVNWKISEKTASFRRNWSESCNAYGGCPMKQICLVKEPESWLSTYYEQRRWNPLERT